MCPLTNSWIPLQYLKSYNPVELAEYASGKRLDVEPTIQWWVLDILRRCNRIIAKVKSKYWSMTHKFGIQVPKYVNEALAIDKENGNTLCYTAIQKEMKNVRVAFEAWEKGSLYDARRSQKLVGYQEIRCHMIFDIKMVGRFTCKTRYVASSHTTDPPSAITYYNGVYIDSVRIVFTLAALNDVEIRAAGIGNAYLNAKCRENIWTVAGTEFGSEKGKAMLVFRALYGLKSSGAAWRQMLSQTQRDLGYASSKADPDV